MKKVAIAGLFLVLLMLIIYGVNYIQLQSKVNSKILNDKRNEGVKVSVHYKYYILVNTLIFDVKEVSDKNSPADVFRVFLQSSEALKENFYNQVYLYGYGSPKFYIIGNYFKLLGEEYKNQNPLYTMRTFPENLYLINGEKAYADVEGGLIGVLSTQTANFKDVYTKWFVNK